MTRSSVRATAGGQCHVVTSCPLCTDRGAMTVANVGRFVDREGCHQARDLGGVGGPGPGRLVRAGSLDGLTSRDWTALAAHGVRTVIDLRNDDGRGSGPIPAVGRCDHPADPPRRHRAPGLAGRVVGHSGIRHPRVFPAFPGTLPRPGRDRRPRRGRCPARWPDPEARPAAAGPSGAEPARPRGRLVADRPRAALVASPAGPAALPEPPADRWRTSSDRDPDADPHRRTRPR
ncbi:tyrosine-protein phosphatase [Streptomyces sp. NPDC001568]|uniref:tyrosine-protein phosphatase n=1 Tax=Streptomyces sp. NPDC001568 TaxID=3364588 RepID=UPI0036888D4F